MIISSVMKQNFLVGRLSHEVGWKYQDVVAKLEAKRKVKGAAYHEQKKKLEKLYEQVCFI